MVIGGSYVVLIFLLWVALVLIGVAVGQKWRFEWSKLSSFECGFDSLSSTRSPFSLRFFLLALLFLVFDVEIVLLFPFVFSLKVLWLKTGLLTEFCYFLLLVILVVGLYHELNEGTLDWETDK